MASPQIENGFTRIANELLMAITRYHCSCGEKDIILAVVRQTYGYQRKSAPCSIGFLTKGTRRHRNKVASDLNALIKKKVISVDKEATNTSARILSLNKNYEQWVSVKTVTVPKGSDGGVTVDSAKGITVDGDQKRKERKLKKLSQEKEAESIYNYYKEKIRAGAKTDAIRSIKKLLNTYSIDQLVTTIDRYIRNGMQPDQQYRIQANNFFGRAARFEDYLKEPQTETRSEAIDTVEDDPKYQEWLEGKKHERNATPTGS